MRNLAGVEDCDRYIGRELERCRIETIEGAQVKGEVPYSLTGKLGPFTFRRAWYYWIAAGPMPLAVARGLYADPVGLTDIRVAGHCGCPPPEPPWLTFRDAEGELVHDPGLKQAIEWASFVTAKDGSVSCILRDHPRPRFVPDAFAVATSITVDGYHIDSEVGLRLFADTIRAHGLDKDAPTAGTGTEP